MPDPRFFEDLGPAPLGELAALAGARLADAAAGGRQIRTAAILSPADREALTFLSDPRHAAGFGATLGPRGIVDVPQLGRVILQDGVTIGANSCVDRGAWEDTQVGENTKIDNQVMIAHNVVIGRNCVLAAHTGVSGSVTIG